MKTANGSQMCCSKQIEIDGRTWGQYLYALSACRGTAASDAYIHSELAAAQDVRIIAARHNCLTVPRCPYL